MKVGRKCGTGAMVNCQCRAHEIVPELCGYGPAANLPEGLVVIATDPHPDDKVAGESDEQCIPIFLRRARLAERRYRQRGAAARALVGRGIEEVERGGPVSPTVERALRARRAEEGLETFRLLLLR